MAGSNPLPIEDLEQELLAVLTAVTPRGSYALDEERASALLARIEAAAGAEGLARIVARWVDAPPVPGRTRNVFPELVAWIARRSPRRELAPHLRRLLDRDLEPLASEQATRALQRVLKAELLDAAFVPGPARAEAIRQAIASAERIGARHDLVEALRVWIGDPLRPGHGRERLAPGERPEEVLVPVLAEIARVAR